MAPPPAPPPSNALWLTFIGAWRDEAQARGSKAAQTYSKAYRSLSACPIPFQHPCETTQLVGIGPTIASRLEDELRKWCEENGEVMPERPAVSTSKPGRKSSAASPKGKTKARAPKKANATAGAGGGNTDDDDDDDDSPSSEGEGARAGGKRSSTSSKSAKAAAPAKKPRAAAPKKPYVPQYRSGGYGLLLGLFSKTHRGAGGEEVYVSKAELVEASQPYCDSDYLTGGGGSGRSASASIVLPAPSQAASNRPAPRSYYSAWSSMKTLITKGYVYQTGNPPKFCLSDQGFPVAETMAKEAGVTQSDSADRVSAPVAGPSRLADSDREQAAKSTAASPPRKKATKAATSSNRPAEPAGPSHFRYAYLLADDGSRAVLSRADAAQRPSRSGAETCYRIRFPRSLSGHETAAQHVELIEEDETAADMLTGYLREAKAELVAPGLRGSSRDDGRFVPPDNDVSIAIIDASSDEEDAASAAGARHQGPATKAAVGAAPLQRRVPRLPSTVPPPGAESSWHGRLHPSSRSASGTSGGVSSGTESTAATRRTDSTLDETVKGTDGADLLDGPDDGVAALAPAAAPAPAIPDFDPIIMPMGSFTIHFILDNRERRHSRDAHGKVSLAGALEKKGVAVEVRALELGDAIWVARRRDGGGAEGDEVVLDFVVERKRLDDLTSSILDGRWKEQKFRLSSSGLSQVVYLVEDHDVEAQMRRFGEQIQTALSSTQVVDGFFVERTAGLDASIDYLARLDGVVRDMYAEAELQILPDAVVSRSTYTALQGELRARRPGTHYVTTYAAYQLLNGKSTSLTLGDVFGKMLLCMRGMSAEKVREVLDLWQTPRQLWEAYEALEAEQPGSGEAMLSNRIQPPEQRKRVGAALSAKAHAVFRSRSYGDG